MSEATFTFQVDETLKGDFTRAAEQRGTTDAQLLRNFMRDHVLQQQEAVSHEAWFRRQVQQGIDSAKAGELLSSEDVEADADAWRAETLRASNLTASPAR